MLILSRSFEPSPKPSATLSVLAFADEIEGVFFKQRKKPEGQNGFAGALGAELSCGVWITCSALWAEELLFFAYGAVVLIVFGAEITVEVSCKDLECGGSADRE